MRKPTDYHRGTCIVHRSDDEQLISVDSSYVRQQAADAFNTFIAPLRGAVMAVIHAGDPAEDRKD